MIFVRVSYHLVLLILMMSIVPVTIWKMPSFYKMSKPACWSVASIISVYLKISFRCNLTEFWALDLGWVNLFVQNMIITNRLVWRITCIQSACWLKPNTCMGLCSISKSNLAERCTFHRDSGQSKWYPETEYTHEADSCGEAISTVADEIYPYTHSRKQTGALVNRYRYTYWDLKPVERRIDYEWLPDGFLQSDRWEDIIIAYDWTHEFLFLSYLIEFKLCRQWKAIWIEKGLH